MGLVNVFVNCIFIIIVIQYNLLYAITYGQSETFKINNQNDNKKHTSYFKAVKLNLANLGQFYHVNQKIIQWVLLNGITDNGINWLTG